MVNQHNNHVNIQTNQIGPVSMAPEQTINNFKISTFSIFYWVWVYLSAICDHKWYIVHNISTAKFPSPYEVNQICS